MVALVHFALSYLLAACVAAAELHSFYDHEVVPDVIPVAPGALLTVRFETSGEEAAEGNEVVPSRVHELPRVSWDADPHIFYTLCMTDPDAPSRSDPHGREHRHWLVGNIPGASVGAGDTLTPFLPSGPPPGTGLHRYVFLVYAQPALIHFGDDWIEDPSDRALFSISDFAEKYEMAGPVAGNFYSAQHEPSDI